MNFWLSQKFDQNQAKWGQQMRFVLFFVFIYLIWFEIASFYFCINNKTLAWECRWRDGVKGIMNLCFWTCSLKPFERTDSQKWVGLHYFTERKGISDETIRGRGFGWGAMASIKAEVRAEQLFYVITLFTCVLMRFWSVWPIDWLTDRVRHIELVVEGLSGYPGQVSSRVFQRARLMVCFSVNTRCFCASECAWSFVKGNNGAASPFAVRLLLPGNLNTVRICSLYTARWLLLCWFQGTIRLQMLLLCCYCKYSSSAYCYNIVLHPQTLTFVTQPSGLSLLFGNILIILVTLVCSVCHAGSCRALLALKHLSTWVLCG